MRNQCKEVGLTFLSRLKQEAFHALQLIRKGQIRLAVHTYGWKLVAGLVIYYLIRDSFLFILLPYLILT